MAGSTVLVVSCGSCGYVCRRVGAWSAYEQQAIESRPCPGCGAYTLRSPEPTPPGRPSRKFRVVKLGHSRPTRLAG